MLASAGEPPFGQPPALAVWRIRFANRPADTEHVKPLRILLVAFAIVIVAGTIASAATGGAHGNPTPSPSVAVSHSPSPELTETEAPDAETTTPDESGTPADFSACDGLTGLDNATCRHDALLKVKPANPGLTNSVAHLQANLAAKADKKAAKAAHGTSGSHGPSGRSANAPIEPTSARLQSDMARDSSWRRAVSHRRMVVPPTASGCLAATSPRDDVANGSERGASNAISRLRTSVA